MLTLSDLTELNLKRFWDKVHKIDGGCWVWTGGKLPKGYGIIRINGVNYYAHRISALIHGKLDYTKHICHTCDNPPCVNPEHLFAGGPKDNSRDMARKGRDGFHVKPESYKHLKTYPPELIRAIGDATGLGKDVAARFGVSRAMVSRIRNGKEFMRWAATSR